MDASGRSICQQHQLSPVQDSTHLTLDSPEDKWFHDEFSLSNTFPLEAALLLMGFLTNNTENVALTSHKRDWTSKMAYSTLKGVKDWSG